MSDFPADPTYGTECPHCDEEATLTALLGPANCARCKNPDCPIRDFWTIATREDFGMDGPVGNIDFDEGDGKPDLSEFDSHETWRV